MRVDAGGGLPEVGLEGRDTGVECGDQVATTGVEVAGPTGAVSVRNMTTGMVLRRHGLGRLVVLALVDAWLVAVVISQVVAR